MTLKLRDAAGLFRIKAKSSKLGAWEMQKGRAGKPLAESPQRRPCCAPLRLSWILAPLLPNEASLKTQRFAASLHSLRISPDVGIALWHGKFYSHEAEVPDRRRTAQLRPGPVCPVNQCPRAAVGRRSYCPPGARRRTPLAQCALFR